MSGRPFLVIVRAGDNSLHGAWLKGGQPRTWDLLVNYYGDDPQRYRADDVVRIDSKGLKWPALHDLIRAHPDIMRRYSHIWLPDDDLLVDQDGINRLFATCQAHGLEIAQPALTWDSYASHLVTLRHTNTRIRFTNFVEIMAPCFSAAMLEKSLPLLVSNMSGWGLDFVWPNLADNPDAGIAVIDTVAVRHTRPIGGPNHKAMQASGITPRAELNAFCERHRISPVIRTHKAIDRHGQVVRAAGRERRFAFRLLAGCLPALRDSPERLRMLQRLAKSALWSGMNRPYRV